MLEKYIGKDCVHYGCGLHLDPEIAWKKIARSARKNIKKAEDVGFNIKRPYGKCVEELYQLRQIWYYPEDPNFPNELNDSDILYMAYLEGNLVGGVILVPVGRHLFLNNLMANDVGKTYQLQGFLLWHAVNDLKNSQYEYIDVGVSYRLNLYRFFKKWSTFHYPVIFNPPKLRPSINFNPFKGLVELGDAAVDEEIVSEFFANEPHTIVPDMMYAKHIAAAEEMERKRVYHEFDNKYKYSGKELTCLDLTRILPINHGAVVLGVELPPKDIWDKYGCYDHYKTEYIKKFITKTKPSLREIYDARLEISKIYMDYFKMEDVEIFIPPFCEYLGVKLGETRKISEKYHLFGVETFVKDDYVCFPCHQHLDSMDIEYIYAIYRGYLNLCSEWQSTPVKGELK